MSCYHDAGCIRRVPIFQGLQDAEVELLQKVTHHRQYRKGDFIFREGDLSETLYVVNNGLIKISKISDDGKEQIFRLLFPGDFFGQSALLQSEHHYANAEALVNTIICTIGKEDFLQTMERNHEMAFRFMMALNERLHQADEWMSLLSLKEVEKRLASVLLLFSHKANAKNGKFTLPISKKVLASLIGATPETISRKLVAFVTDHIISMNGQRDVHILDYQALKQVAGE